ncbi:MAG TPA: hypothetical protein VER55_01900, partial [Ardenticatenaceae bacterium]|nr:hypothetical protein [Ardenticatenaceae bacterium]
RVTALTPGAAAAARPVAEQIVKDAYGGLKSVIQRKYGRVDVEQLEKEPGDELRQVLVKKELAGAKADEDEEVLRQARALLEAVERHAPEAATAVGVSLRDVKAAALKIGDIISTGTGVSVEQSAFEGDIEIRQVRAGAQRPSNRPKPSRREATSLLP